jgi:hypothetical protein
MTIKADIERIEVLLHGDLALAERTRLGGMLSRLQSVRGVDLQKTDLAYLLAIENRLAISRGDKPRGVAGPSAAPSDSIAVPKTERYDTPECLRRENLPMKPPGGRAYVPGPSRFDRSRDE